jgi:hypothetical protein
MYVVTQSGKKLKVDDSEIDYEHELVESKQTVGLYTDDVILKKTWILELYKITIDSKLHPKQCITYEDASSTDLSFDHYPTNEEILWAMSQYGLTFGDYVHVNEVLTLDYDNNDD